MCVHVYIYMIHKLHIYVAFYIYIEYSIIYIAIIFPFTCNCFLFIEDIHRLIVVQIKPIILYLNNRMSFTNSFRIPCLDS